MSVNRGGVVVLLASTGSDFKLGGLLFAFSCAASLRDLRAGAHVIIEGQSLYLVDIPRLLQLSVT